MLIFMLSPPFIVVAPVPASFFTEWGGSLAPASTRGDSACIEHMSHPEVPMDQLTSANPAGPRFLRKAAARPSLGFRPADPRLCGRPPLGHRAPLRLFSRAALKVRDCGRAVPFDVGACNHGLSRHPGSPPTAAPDVGRRSEPRRLASCRLGRQRNGQIACDRSGTALAPGPLRFRSCSTSRARAAAGLALHSCRRFHAVRSTAAARAARPVDTGMVRGGIRWARLRRRCKRRHEGLDG